MEQRVHLTDALSVCLLVSLNQHMVAAAIYSMETPQDILVTASGIFLPPLKKIKEELLNGTPPGTIGLNLEEQAKRKLSECQKSGSKKFINRKRDETQSSEGLK
ncbi:hypothetical protein J6590_098543 [Homalodisca vitripennis]|nr:hypothetical protein J6590_029328 [Homalodisca vitripennis]KAG8289728.1 hypothetical protein J6590_098543 [Homalodisca vitripennis]